MFVCCWEISRGLLEEQSRRRGRKDGTRHRERAGLRLEQGQLLHCNLGEGRTRAQRTRSAVPGLQGESNFLGKGVGRLGKTQLSLVAVNLFASSFVATGAAV